MNILNEDSNILIQSLPDKSVDLIITDPPYEMSNDDKLFFHHHFLRICKGTIVVFMPPENQWVIPAEQYLFWIKPISTKNTSRRYSRFVEMLFLYNTQVGTWNSSRHWSQYTNVFTDLVDHLEYHSFRKPPSLITRLMLNHSNEGDLVLDPFAGSGTVGEVAKLLHRDYTLIEKDINLYKSMIERMK